VQFAQTEPVRGGGTAGALVSAASLGANLFGQFTDASQKRGIAEAESAEKTALGQLESKLINIKQAGATGGVEDVRWEQDLALSKFNTQNPEYVRAGGAVFKTATGRDVAGLTLEEQGEIKRGQEAMDNGHGNVSFSDETNEALKEQYFQLKGQDFIATKELKQIELSKAVASQKKAKQAQVAMTHFQSMAKTFDESTVLSTNNVVANFQADQNTQQEGLFTINKIRGEVNTMIRDLGVLGTDPNVMAFTKPILDKLKTAEDLLLKKISTEAYEANSKNDLAMSDAMFT
ncbi:unnamed protein product, partial [marine sediment metagenome]